MLKNARLDLPLEGELTMMGHEEFSQGDANILILRWLQVYTFVKHLSNCILTICADGCMKILAPRLKKKPHKQLLNPT